MISIDVWISSIASGLIFSVLAMGVAITFNILNIADLSVEGTFPFGAFVFARVLTAGFNPFTSMALSFVFGLLSGLLTYIWFKKLKVDAILAGILTMTILYSVNLRIFGQSNVPIVGEDTIFTIFDFVPEIVVLAVISIVIKLALDWYLKTEKGYLLIATGDNEDLVKQLGNNPDKYTCIGLMLSNGLIALSGCIQGQFQSFVDVTMGQTMIVNALASIIIGQTFLRTRNLKMTTRAIIGSIIYRIIYGIAIDKGLNPNDLKAITAFIVIIFIFYNDKIVKRKAKKVKEYVTNKKSI